MSIPEVPAPSLPVPVATVWPVALSTSVDFFDGLKSTMNTFWKSMLNWSRRVTSPWAGDMSTPGLSYGVSGTVTGPPPWLLTVTVQEISGLSVSYHP